MLADLAPLERSLFVLGRPVPIMKSVLRPAVSWEAVAPGLTFPVLEYVVTDEAVDWYYRTLARPLPNLPLARPENVPPLLFADEPMQCVNTLFSRSGRLHAGQLMESFLPIPVNVTVRAAACVSARYEKSTNQFYEVDCVISIVHEDHIEQALRVRATFVI